MRTLVALALLPLCAPPLFCQIIVIQGSDPISSSRGVINTNFSYLETIKVPTTRTLTAGTGLTGGGTLSADRTFSIALPTVSTLGGVMSKICAGSDKLSAIGTDGIPVCSADTGTGGGVTSFIGRTGVVIAVSGDYNASQITFTPSGTIAAVTTATAIAELDAEKQPLNGGLTSLAGLALTDDALAVSNGSVWQSKVIPSCSNPTLSKLLYDISTNTFTCGVDQTAGGGGAPTTATYITQTADAGLSAEQALSLLATGFLKVTTVTGVLSSQAAMLDADVPDTITLTNLTQVQTRNHSDLTGVGVNTHSQIDAYLAAGSSSTTDIGLLGLKPIRTNATTLTIAAGGYVPEGKAAVSNAGGTFVSVSGTGTLILCANDAGLFTVQTGTAALSARPSGITDGGTSTSCTAVDTDAREFWRWPLTALAGQFDTTGTDVRYALTSPAPCNSTADAVAARNINGGCDYTAPATIAQRASIQSGAYLYAAGTGTAAVATATVTGLTAYTEGQTILYEPEDTNTTTQTLNINGLGAKSILTAAGAALAAGDLTAGRYYPLTYDGAAYRLPAAGGAAPGGSSARMIEYVGAKCQNGFASSGFSWGTTGFPTASCDGTDTGGYGLLSFADAVTQTVNDRFVLPASVTTASLDIIWRTSAITGSVVWQLQTVCVAPGEVMINPTYGTAVPTTSPAQGVTLRNAKATLAVSLTGCVANEILRFKLLRDPTHGSDTLAATADLLSAVFTVQP